MPAHLKPETLRFLRGLAKNNDRVWFEDRRDQYERFVKKPQTALIEELNAAMDNFVPNYIRPPHKVALRIYRDIRFSPDKRPYKTHLGARWSSRQLSTTGASFYLDIAPDRSFIAAGLYAPERDETLALRRWLAEHHQQYREVLAPLLTQEPHADAMQMLPAEALTRNPKGFTPEHPASDLLRARNWGVMLDLPADLILSPSLGTVVVAHFRRVAPLVQLLNEALLGTGSSSSTRSLR